MSSRTNACTRPHPPQRPSAYSGLGPPVSAADVSVDPALVLLQRHQMGLITPGMLAAARRRLGHALETARPGDPGLLLEQLLTDLGITVDLP
jgi:hypothetical protein